MPDTRRRGLARLLPYAPPSTNGDTPGTALVASGSSRATALTAAAEKIEVGDKSAAKLVKRREAWQTECWQMYDLIGEVKYGVNFRANAMARLGLYIGIRPDRPDAEPERLPRNPTEEEAAELAEAGIDAKMIATAWDTLDRIAGSDGSHGDLLRELSQNLDVAGECYLYGHEDDDGNETWDVRSVDEVTADERGDFWITDKPGTATSSDRGHKLTDDEDLFRIYVRHPRYSSQADSALRGVLSSCEELLVMEQAVRSIGRSRLNAGLLLMPDELDYGPAEETADEGDGQAADDPFLTDLMEAMTLPIQDEGSASAVVPMLIKGKGEHLERIKHLILERPFDEQIEPRTERALKRLGQGINIPIEVITGMADVNHWTAWQIEDSTFRMHLAPGAEMIVVALTIAFLHPMLRAADIDPEQLVVWYDPTRLVARTNVADNAVRAHTKKLITDAAARAALGFDDGDAPDAVAVDEAVARALDMVTAAPSLLGIIEGGLPALVDQIRGVLGGADVETDMPAVGTEGDGTADDVGEDVSAPPADPTPATGMDALTRQAMVDEMARMLREGGVDPDTTAYLAAGTRYEPDPPRVSPRLGQILGRIDRDLRVRLQAAADAQMRRALERVGANLRSRARKDRATLDAISHVDNEHVAATLGPKVVAALGADELDMLDGSFDQLRPRFDSWVQTAQYGALGLVPDLADHDAEQARAELDRFRDEAWRWLHGALMEAAKDRLYDPDPEPDGELGEWDGSMLVDLDLIREAIARAGGAFSAEASVTAAVDVQVLSRGVATGPYMAATLATQDVAVDGWEWVYGPFPRQRNFEPHERLDGLLFTDFTDPALANPHPFPPGGYYLPGDHRGCQCDVVPVTIDLGSATLDIGMDPVEVAATPDAGPNLGRASELFYDSVDEAQAAGIPIRRHGGGGYTTPDGRWYIHRVGEQAWAVERQTRGRDGILRAERVAVTPILQAARTYIARNG